MQTPHGWHGAVTYHIDPRHFPGLRGEGAGDLRGIEARLDHVASLGVDAIGIPASVVPSMADLDRLLAKAHALGLKVMIDAMPGQRSNEKASHEESRDSRDDTAAGQLAFRENVRALMAQHPDVVALSETSCEDLPGRLTGAGSPDVIRRTVEALQAHLPDGWPCWSVGSREVAHGGQSSMPAGLANQFIALACSLRGSICLHPGEAPGSPEADSTLRRFRRFLAWRHRQPALMAGDIRFLDAPEPVLAFERTHPEQRFLVVFNLSDEPQTVVLPGLENLTADPGHGLPAGQADDRQVFLPARGVYYAVTPAG